MDAVLDTVSEFATALPPVLSAATTTRPYEISAHMNTHLVPGLAQYESIGAHFNVPAVLFATAFTTSVGVLAAWQLWERGFRKLVFPEEELAEAQTNPSPNLVCGVDCGAFPIFTHPKVRTAVTFAERWHHGQYRRTVRISHVTHSASLIAHTRLTFLFTISGRAVRDALRRSGADFSRHVARRQNRGGR